MLFSHTIKSHANSSVREVGHLVSIKFSVLVLTAVCLCLLGAQKSTKLPAVILLTSRMDRNTFAFLMNMLAKFSQIMAANINGSTVYRSCYKMVTLHCVRHTLNSTIVY